MQRAYAVLKCIFAFFCVMMSVIIAFTIGKMALFTDYFEKLNGTAQKLGGQPFYCFFLWLAFCGGNKDLDLFRQYFLRLCRILVHLHNQRIYIIKLQVGTDILHEIYG
jgi:hypothetical protein